MTAAEVMDPADALAGATPDHRSVYTLLLEHPDGLTRDAARTLTGLPDRRFRAIVEDLRILAAVRPHPKFGALIAGFDPQGEVYAFAQNRQQADRMLAYHASRVTSMARALYHQSEAAVSAFGGDGRAPGVQDALFAADSSLRAFRRWRTT